MRPKVIRTEKDHRAALARIEELFDAKPGTADCDELEVLAILVERYEEEKYPIPTPDAVTAIRFRMEQMGMTRGDLAKMLGSASRASEILSGRRKPSVAMMRVLVSELGIPAEVFLSAPRGVKRRGASAGALGSRG